MDRTKRMRRWLPWVVVGLGAAVLALCQRQMPVESPVRTGADTTGAPGKVYVANSGSNSISVIDVQKLEVVATIDLGMAPFAIAAAKQGSDVYVSSRDGRGIVRIDALTGRVVQTYTLQAQPWDLTCGYDGNVYFVIEPRSGSMHFTGPLFVGRLDPAGGAIREKAIEFGLRMVDVFIESSPLGEIIIAGGRNPTTDNFRGWKLSFLAMASIVADTVLTDQGDGAYTGATTSLDGNTFFGLQDQLIYKVDVAKYVAASSSRRWWEDANTLIRLDAPESSSSLIGLVIEPSGRTGYVAGTKRDPGPGVFAVSLTTGAVVASTEIPVTDPNRTDATGTSRRIVGLASEAGLVFVSLYGQNTVAVLAAETLRVLKTIPVGSAPTSIAVVQ